MPQFITDFLNAYPGLAFALYLGAGFFLMAGLGMFRRCGR